MLCGPNASRALRQRAPAPSPRSPPHRLRRFLLLASLSLTSFSLGIYLASHPVISTLTALRRPSSASSSLAYLPHNERTAEINNLITTHPLSQRLRSDPAWTESRPHLQMPPMMQQHSLTASTLRGDTKIPVPPLMFTKGNQGEELIAISYLGADLCGHVGIVHGGLLATMLDEGLARCSFAALPSKVGVTARLEIDFKRPTRSEGFVVLKARTERVEGRKAWVRGRVEVLEMPGLGKVEESAGVGEEKKEISPFEEKGEVLVEAEGLFVEPKWAKVPGVDGLIEDVQARKPEHEYAPTSAEVYLHDSPRSTPVQWSDRYTKKSSIKKLTMLNRDMDSKVSSLQQTCLGSENFTASKAALSSSRWTIQSAE
ncbi:MAG: hypothetical protein Q9182_002053 [Xanthomendoza sp. 2 TL-2023]